ncbi:LysR family transcriptional regulator [Vibrio paucivorans]
MSQPNKFDLNLLRVFISAYEQESVTRAAEQLDLTQSAVSNALNRLKDSVGHELFARTGRGIKPTRFAQDFYLSLQGPLLDIEGVMEGIQEFDPATTRRRFVIYCHEALIHDLRQKIDKVLKDSSIEVVLIDLPANEEQISEDLTAEKVDVVVDVNAPNSRVFRSQIIMRDSLCCITHKDHPRLNADTISKEAYLAERHALFDMTRFNLKFVDWITEGVLPQRKVYSEHKSLLGMMAAVSYSDAVGVVPHTIANQYKEVFNLVILDFPFETKTFDSHLVYLSKMNANPANRWVRELIMAQV